MPYRIVHVDVSRKVEAVDVPDGVQGLAFVLHRGERPVGFFLEPKPDRPRMSAERVRRLIEERAAEDILADSVRQELGSGANATPISITAAICTKDHEALVTRCLARLTEVRRRSMRPGDRIEILVVDNAPSTDGTRRVVEQFEGVRYTCEPRPGLDFARNRAVAESTTEWLAFLDDDLIVDGYWIEGLRTAIAENADAGAFTGPVLPLELETDAQVLFEQRGGFRRGFRRIRHTTSAPRTRFAPCDAGVCGAGCNMTFRRDVLLGLGGFDEALDTGRPLPGGGDLDIFYRVVRAGHVLAYEPLLTVFHQHRKAHHELRRQMWTWGLGFMAFVAKSFRNDPPMRKRFTVLVVNWMRYMSGMFVRTAIGRNPHPWGADLALAELAGGIVGLLGEYGRSQSRIRAIKARHS